ncbi:TetR/AcrR family transcriptional regulator [Hydrocarboniclastica marina]|uniref:TetR/AcrR family transcriptional regulator n=2 Tax=Hydrocarboniclastica marina TaxID=2259620 RepID=A0A4P7XKZ6_9ALTE|nr:TetR/AcrR family transcriptional regulator [Hydrocarboniclastica marina]
MTILTEEQLKLTLILILTFYKACRSVVVKTLCTKPQPYAYAAVQTPVWYDCQRTGVAKKLTCVLNNHGGKMAPKQSGGKGRGRPPGSTGPKMHMRMRILNATREVYSERGLHNTTVELILESAGVSRPTFYKYFSSVWEAIEAVVMRCNEELEVLFTEVFSIQRESAIHYLPTVLVGYLNWGRSQGKLMEARFRELHDLTSPVGVHRTEHNERISNLLSDMLVADGRTAPDRVALNALVNCVEYLGYQFCNGARQEEMPVYLRAMGRVSLALLGSEADWQNIKSDPVLSSALGFGAPGDTD